jgi:sugar lactone lactonase YvrE
MSVCDFLNPFDAHFYKEKAMQLFQRKFLALCCAVLVTGCGGGSSPGAANSDPASTSPMVLAAGSTFTMTANISVLVPSGTVVTSANGNVVTVNGTNNTVSTQAGAVVTVPANATGPATDLVTTGQAPTGSVSTAPANITLLAGSATTSFSPADGTGAAAILRGGGHMVVDANGNIIISDRGSLRKITPGGVVTTRQAANGFDFYEGIAIDAAGNIFGSYSFVASSPASPTVWGALINELTAAGVPQQLLANWENSSSSSSIGVGAMAVDSKGNLYLADVVNNRIVKFPTTGNWNVFAGSGASGDIDGAGASATFTMSFDSEIAIDALNNLFVVSNGLIRKIAPDGTVATIGGRLATTSSAIAIDQAGNIYLAGSGKLYRVSSSGTVTSFAFPNTTDFVASMVTDKKGNLYVSTRGLGAQIFKIAF